LQRLQSLPRLQILQGLRLRLRLWLWLQMRLRLRLRLRLTLRVVMAGLDPVTSYFATLSTWIILQRCPRGRPSMASEWGVDVIEKLTARRRSRNLENTCFATATGLVAISAEARVRTS
jgi:hypothetical protein